MKTTISFSRKTPLMDAQLKLATLYCTICYFTPKQQSWHNLVETLDMRKRSRKAWNLIRKLGNDHTTSKLHTNVTANQVAHQLVLNGKTTHRVKVNSKIDRSVPLSVSTFSRPLSEEELNDGIKSMKNGKAAGLDNIFVEEVKHFGPKTKNWILQFFNNCHHQKKIPKIGRRSKVFALLKPGKDPSQP